MKIIELKQLLRKAAQEKQSIEQFLSELSSISNDSFEELVFDIFDSNFSPSAKHSLMPHYIKDGTDLLYTYFKIHATKPKFNNTFNYNRLGLTFEFDLNVECYDSNKDELIMTGAISGKYNVKQAKVKLSGDSFYYAKVPMHEEDYKAIPDVISHTIAYNLHTDYCERSKLIIPVNFYF